MFEKVKEFLSTEGREANKKDFENTKENSESDIKTEKDINTETGEQNGNATENDKPGENNGIENDEGHQSEDDLQDMPEAEVAEENEKPEETNNKIEGTRREEEVEAELNEKYPESEGYTIVREAPLRDKDGNIVKDKETDSGRRVDFVVIKDGKVVAVIEVTSKTADKTEQTAKENRIRENGGNYIKDKDGNLLEIPNEVKTEIVRRD